VIERQTLKLLSRDSGHSVSSLKRLFAEWLGRAPTFRIKPRERVHLLVDGTYFTNDLCLVLYYDSDVRYTQLYRFSSKEDYGEMKEDLENLMRLGVEVESITCDGHRSLLRAIRKVYPEVAVQRCVVHVQRQVATWLRKKPKLLISSELKAITAKLPLIQTHNDRLAWRQEFDGWLERNRGFVYEQSVSEATGKKWYTHKQLHQAVSHVLGAMPNLFHYLDNPAIPKSTNGLESFFGHLKDNLSIHRGLSQGHRRQFIRWYLHLKNARRT
jgi:AraC-like DNA-binding protein